MIVDHHPVFGLSELVRLARVGEKRRQAPIASRSVEDREPCLAARVEALRGDRAQLTGFCFLPVFPVDIEQESNGRRFRGKKLSNVSVAKPFGDGGANGGGSSMSDARDRCQAAVVSRKLERLERVDVQRTMDSCRPAPALHRAGSGTVARAGAPPAAARADSSVRWSPSP